TDRHFIAPPKVRVIVPQRNFLCGRGAATKGWSAQGLPPGVRWPKNRVVGFLGEESEKIPERTACRCTVHSILTKERARYTSPIQAACAASAACASVVPTYCMVELMERCERACFRRARLIACYKMRRQRMLQHMWVPLLAR